MKAKNTPAIIPEGRDATAMFDTVLQDVRAMRRPPQVLPAAFLASVTSAAGDFAVAVALRSCTPTEKIAIAAQLPALVAKVRKETKRNGLEATLREILEPPTSTTATNDEARGSSRTAKTGEESRSLHAPPRPRKTRTFKRPK